MSTAAPPPAGPSPVLVFDGGCPFCRHFAELSELQGGIPGLVIRDGRADDALRQSLNSRGYPLRDGAVLLAGDEVLHGAAAIGWICERMRPSAALLRLLGPLFASPRRAERLYPLLLLARRLALAWRGLPPDPDHPSAPEERRRLDSRQPWRSLPMANPATDSEEAGFAPIQAGSIHDRLARWCERDPLEREAAVLKSLAACREILHRQSDPSARQVHVSVPAEDLAVLVCAVQTGLCPTSRCDN